MSTGGVLLLSVVGLILLLIFAVRYADRAIREKRPGWVSPPEPDPTKGLCCPNAAGHKGEEGQPGREEHELQSRSDR